MIAAGQWQYGDRSILIVMDAGYDVMRLAWVLRDLPVELVGRLRPDRVLRLPKPPRIYDPKGGRPPKHVKEFSLARPVSWPEPSVVTVNDTPRYGKAEARAWDRLHPRLQQRSVWIDHDSELPGVKGGVRRGRRPPRSGGVPCRCPLRPRSGARATSASSSSHIDPADDLTDVVLHSDRVAYPDSWSSHRGTPGGHPSGALLRLDALTPSGRAAPNLWQYLREQANAGPMSPERLTHPRLRHAALTRSAHTDTDPSAVAPFP